MGEFLAEPGSEAERETGLRSIIEQYFPDDEEFLECMEEPDKIGYIYGSLLEQGDDPDVILQEFGVTEEKDEI